jgi:P27 family predicted phage terminase small subunit
MSDSSTPDLPAPMRRLRSPRPPGWLGEDAREVWAEFAPALRARGEVSPVDKELLAILCDSVVLLRASREYLNAGVLIRRGNGELVINPSWRAYRDAAGLIRSYANELGITRSTRRSVSE